jgi:hypothetical protein
VVWRDTGTHFRPASLKSVPIPDPPVTGTDSISAEEDQGNFLDEKEVDENI